MQMLKKWAINLLYATDLWFNALFLGDPEETISSRIGKKSGRDDCKLCQWICRLLDKIDPRHCAKAVNWNQGRGSEDDDSVMGG